MEEAARARTAAREAVRDITPQRLREVIHDLLAEGSAVPGVLTLLGARAANATGPAVDDRAAGVQLIYAGLALTRRLSRTWTDPDRTTGEAHLEILAADVMVSRGFHLLARTEAASVAVETVRRFGRDETARREADGPAPHSLEADVFELAVVAGATAGGVEPRPGLRGYAADLASQSGAPPLPPADEMLTSSAVDRLAKLATITDASPSNEDVAWHPSTTDP